VHEAVRTCTQFRSTTWLCFARCNCGSPIAYYDRECIAYVRLRISPKRRTVANRKLGWINFGVIARLQIESEPYFIKLVQRVILVGL
jgi:hypothetical protein